MRIEFQDNPFGKLLSEVFSDVMMDDAGVCPGAEVEVYLRGNRLGKAEIMAVTPLPFNRISDAIAFPSTGRNAAHLARVLKVRHGLNDTDLEDRRVLNVVFKYKERDLLLQAEMFSSHWQEIKQNYSTQYDQA